MTKLGFPHYRSALPVKPRRRRAWHHLWPARVAIGFGVIALVPVLSLTVGREGSARPAYDPPTPAMHAPVPPPPSAPPQLQARLDELAGKYGEKVGVAVMDVDKGWVAQVNGDSYFPQQSVSKTWVALTVLDAIDRGELAFEQSVFLGPQDRSVFYQPIVRLIGSKGFTTTVSDLLTRALTQSDNAANDRLIKLVGGVEVVMETLRRKGLEGLRLGADEKRLQAMIAGVPWRDDLVLGNRFREARAALPDYVRDQAMAAYVANPYDGATPVGIVQALTRLKRGQLLSSANSDWMINTMLENTTGHSRLKAGAPRDWKIGDKTGTGQDWRGASVGINDIALMMAPDGRAYAVAVMIQHTKQPNETRRAFMHAVTRAVVDYWRDEEQPGAERAEADRKATPKG